MLLCPSLQSLVELQLMKLHGRAGSPHELRPAQDIRACSYPSVIQSSSLGISWDFDMIKITHHLFSSCERWPMPDRRSRGMGHAENVPGRPKLPDKAAVWKLYMLLSWLWSTQRSASQPRGNGSRWPRPLSQTRSLLWKTKLLWRAPLLLQAG